MILQAEMLSQSDFPNLLLVICELRRLCTTVEIRFLSNTTRKRLPTCLIDSSDTTIVCKLSQNICISTLSEPTNNHVVNIYWSDVLFQLVSPCTAVREVLFQAEKSTLSLVEITPPRHPGPITV